MTNVIKLAEDQRLAIGEVRQAAAAVLEWLLRHKALAQKHRRQIQSAKTAERAVFSFARWLGVYYNESYGPHPYLRRVAGGDILIQTHRSALDAIEGALDSIRHAVTIGTPWRSLPNLMHTKFAASELLGRVIAALDKAIGSVALLQGVQAEEKNSA